MTSRIIAAMMLLALAACGSPPPLGGPGVVVADTGGLPPPTREDLVSASRPYLIGPFDKLHIDVFGVEDLQRDVQIDASGNLSFPLVGIVDAAGMTPDELAEVIRQRLRGQYIRDPQVTVNLLETVSQAVTVDGQVNDPGVYPVIGQMTLMRAVATAGGVGEFARLSDVVVFRHRTDREWSACTISRGSAAVTIRIRRYTPTMWLSSANHKRGGCSKISSRAPPFSPRL